jgi:hypothetical protein
MSGHEEHEITGERDHLRRDHADTVLMCSTFSPA